MKEKSSDPKCSSRFLPKLFGCWLVGQDGGRKRGLDGVGSCSDPLRSFLEKLMVCLRFLSIVDGRRENCQVTFHRSLHVKEEAGYWRWNLIGQEMREIGAGQQNGSEIDYLGHQAYGCLEKMFYQQN